MTYLIETLRFFRRQWFQIAWIILPIIIPVAVLSHVIEHFFVQESASHFIRVVPLLLVFLVHPLYIAALITYLNAVQMGQHYSTQYYWTMALRKWSGLLSVIVLTFLAVLCATLLIAPLLGGIGVPMNVVMMVIAILAFVIIVRLYFAELIVVLTDQDAIQSIKTSWQMSKGMFRPLCVGILILSSVLAIPYFGLLTTVVIPKNWLMAEIVLDIVFKWLATLVMIYIFRLYTLCQRQLLQQDTTNESDTL